MLFTNLEKENMKYFILEKENLPAILGNIDNLLSQVEVKGESVGNLFSARVLIKEIFDSVKDFTEEGVKKIEEKIKKNE